MSLNVALVLRIFSSFGNFVTHALLFPLLHNEKGMITDFLFCYQQFFVQKHILLIMYTLGRDSFAYAEGFNYFPSLAVRFVGWLLGKTCSEYPSN